MAKSKQFRTIYEENGNEFIFSSYALKTQILKTSSDYRKNDQKKTQTQIIEELSDKVHASTDAVYQWVRGSNGPGDITIVKDIAEYFGIDFRALIVPRSVLQNISKSESEIVGTDEKDLIMQFHAVLADFIYDYIGNDFRNVYLERRYDAYETFDLDAEISNYIFNVYRQLEKVSLKLSPETYTKLHRFITECKVFANVGVFEATPHMRTLLKYNPRWIEINPFLKIIAEYSNYDDFDGALLFATKKDLDALKSKFNEEADCWYIDGFASTLGGYGIDKMGLGIEDKNDYVPEEDRGNYYFFEPYEAIPMELARTLTLLFRADFPQYFNNKEAK